MGNNNKSNICSISASLIPAYFAFKLGNSLNK
uniref:PSI M-polypeptide n=1 Tax=Euglena hiemalis TaxID=392896 RepID=A0A345UC77_9EUGL|nr:PSI M-polypeptide [Euglena hiemalis]AXI98063.1 PSI M-polypeptide [Euglena hiemalis]